MVKSLLSEDAARDVEAAVARLERGTAAEVVVAVVPRSHDHWQGRVLLALAWGLAAGFGFAYLEPLRDPAQALVAQLAVGMATYWLSGFPALHRRLIPQAAAEQAAQSRAFQLFAQRGLRTTQGRTALLIFVSELEHRVVLMGDHGIDQALGQAGWDEYVKLLVGRIREGRTREGLLEVIERLEPRLAEVAPVAPDDVNEIPNTVLRT
jgi:putative membrane protein